VTSGAAERHAHSEATCRAWVAGAWVRARTGALDAQALLLGLAERVPELGAAAASAGEESKPHGSGFGGVFDCGGHCLHRGSFQHALSRCRFPRRDATLGAQLCSHHQQLTGVFRDVMHKIFQLSGQKGKLALARATQAEQARKVATCRGFLARCKEYPRGPDHTELAVCVAPPQKERTGGTDSQKPKPAGGGGRGATRCTRSCSCLVMLGVE
jgi:hypothetical protein